MTVLCYSVFAGALMAASVSLGISVAAVIGHADALDLAPYQIAGPDDAPACQETDHG